MKRIGLLVCSKRKKLYEKSHNKCRAEDMYLGSVFLKAKNEGLERFCCEDWHILSSKYYLLGRATEIPYYDMYLPEQSCEYKNDWNRQVLVRLNDLYDLKHDVFYIFGDQNYYENLITHLNCVIFNCENGNLDFYTFTEYKNGETHDFI